MRSASSILNSSLRARVAPSNSTSTKADGFLARRIAEGIEAGERGFFPANSVTFFPAYRPTFDEQNRGEKMTDFKTGTVTANGIRISYQEKGEGPLLLCLHGFPDTPATFDGVLDHFADRGYQVVAPWLRGYNPSEIPGGSYQTAVLAQDVLDLITALGHETAIVLGHDWGASCAAAAAILDPHKISHLVTIAIPYGTMKRALVFDPAQQRRSWYMFFFQMAFAETAVAAADFAFLDRLWADWSVTIPVRERDLAKQAFRHPGVLTAALDYYRCLFQPGRHDPAYDERKRTIEAGKIAVPTLHIHGESDGCAGVELLEGMEAFFEAGLTKVVVAGAGHFVHLEKLREVVGAMETFLKERS